MDRGAEGGSPPGPGLPARVLVVRTGAIGDVVNALVLAAAVKDASPDTEVGWVAHPLVVPLLDGNPCVDRVHVWPRGAGVRGALALVREVRARRYDLAVDLQRIQKSALVARLSGAPRVLGHDRGRTKEAAWLWTRERIAAGDPREHMVDQYLAFARHLGAAPGPPRWPLPDLTAARGRAAEALAPARGRALVVLNLGASKPANRWDPGRFAELARGLAGDAAVVLTGGPAEVAAAATVRELAGDAVAVDLVARTGLLELAAVLERADAVATADTGPMHLAVAVGAPVVAIFGPADPARTGPHGEGHIVLRVPEWDGTPRSTSRTDDVGADQALSAVRALLQGGVRLRS